MLLVIADTSPIRYLVLVGHIDLLHRLFFFSHNSA
jgi:predicted nucleic acid-binding protein